MRVILFYEHISREGDEIKAIANHLRTQGVDVRIFSIIFEYTKAVRYARRNKCDVIVMPWAYSEKYYSFAGPFIESNSNAVVVSLDHEEIGSEYSLPALLPNGTNPKESVIHFVWGDYFANILKNAGVRERNIRVVGNGRTDFIFKKNSSRNEYAGKYGLDISKKWILFAENRGFVYTKKKRTIAEHERRGIPSKKTEEFFDHTVKSIEASREDFNKAGEAFFDKYEFIYRPHPGTIAMDDIDNRIKIISEGSIYDWLNVVDINLTWSSTSIFESDAMGVASIIYEPIENKKEFRSFGTENYCRINSLSQLLDEDTVNEALEVQKQQKRYLDFYGIVDGHRCENIANEIVSLKGIEGYSANPVKFDRIPRLTIFESVTAVLSRLNLVKVLKWPTTAYDRYNDIPWLADRYLK